MQITTKTFFLIITLILVIRGVLKWFENLKVNFFTFQRKLIRKKVNEIKDHEAKYTILYKKQSF